MEALRLSPLLASLAEGVSASSVITAWTVRLRRHLHENPELSWEERETSEFVFQTLEDLGLSPRRLATYGVVADIPGEKEKPFIALRADMDALPLQEDTGLSFASKKPGVMHACGHDGHTSMLLGAAALLMQQVNAGNKPKLPVRLVFQPAEESVSGADSMVKDGALENVAAIFGGHIDRAYPVGTMIVHDGCVNASCDTLEIELLGETCHAARPHEGVDAIVMASHLIVQLQTIVSRTVDPAEPAVVTIGKINAGSAFNIVAGKANLLGTVRTVKQETRLRIHQHIRGMADAVASAFGGKAIVTFSDGIPPVVNTSSLVDIAQQAARTATQEAAEPCVTKLPKANMGGEDFAAYLQHVPGFFVRYGAAVPGEANISAHSPRWDFNEECLPIGSRYLAEVARLAAEHYDNEP
eukprot:m.34361 g.34361  ORF g.34361 m.34361 type:complete len:412 (+) comp11008_c0_seq2:94-1329(+)